MELLGVGPLELLFIIVIALIVIGPRDMAKTARKLGRLLNQLYKSQTWRAIMEASRNLRALPNRLAREAALEELDEIRDDLEQSGRRIRKDLEASESRIRADLGAAGQRIRTDLGALQAEASQEAGEGTEGEQLTPADVETGEGAPDSSSEAG
jgi:sec-independent protein translocase protein TatB